MAAKHDCFYEEQIQGQSRKIERLETRADWKDQRLDEIDKKIEKMDEKIDQLLKGFNDLKLQSNNDDSQLELRLKAIETELALQKQTNIDNHNRVSQLLAVVGVGLTIITILINIYFNMIP